MYKCTVQASNKAHESAIMIWWCLMSVHTLNVVAVRTSVGCCIHAVHHKRNPEAQYACKTAQDHAPKPCLTLQIRACGCNNTSHAISTNYLSRCFTKKRLCNHLRRTNHLSCNWLSNYWLHHERWGGSQICFWFCRLIEICGLSNGRLSNNRRSWVCIRRRFIHI